MVSTTIDDIRVETVSGERGARSLRLEEVSKSFGSVQALKPLRLEIRPGELLALLGPSGCGKTTTLRVIAGFETPDTGAVFIGDRDVTFLPPNRRNLGMVFQNYSLFPHMTVGENVAFGLKMQRLGRGEIRERVRRMLEIVRLGNYEDRFVHQLSGGQQQRVALARSLVTSPSVLLLDEPLGALDKNLREGMQFELRQLQKRLNITSVLVTHDQEEALTMSDRVAVMAGGEILQIGPPTEVYERPRNRFVSEFLGTANILHVVVEDAVGDGAYRVGLAAEEGAEHRFVAEAGRPLAAGERVMVAVRPEKLLLEPLAAAGEGALAARVVDRIFRGSYHAYELKLAGRAAPLFVHQQAAESGIARLFAPGSEVAVRWQRESAVLLEDRPS